MSASPPLAPLDQLEALYRGCRLGYASQDDLFTALITARGKLKKPRSEQPADAYLAGWDDRGGLQDIPNSRRREVNEAFREWLPTVAVLSDSEMRLTVTIWAARAKEARQQAAERDKRVRA